MLVFGCFEILENLLGKLGEVFAFDQVVGFEKDFPQTGFADGIVFEVELVESVERIFVRLCE